MDPLLPLNWVVGGGRLDRLAGGPNGLSVVAPNFSESSENTTRMAFGFAESGTKPTLTASDIGQSSKNQGFRGPGRRRDGSARPRFGPHKSVVGGTMACRPPQCQAPVVPQRPQRLNINHV